MDKETELLARVVVNHLFLGQFEPLRAALLSLRRRDPDLALSILRTIVARGGRFDRVLWSPSCPSPSHLAWLSALELLAALAEDPARPPPFDPTAFRSKAEFVLLVQLVVSRVSDSSSVAAQVLERILEVGVSRLSGELDGGGRDGSDTWIVGEEEEEAMRKVVLDEAEIIDAVCWIVKSQAELSEPTDPGTAITLSGGALGDDSEALGWLLKNVQMAHLNAMRKCVETDDVKDAISHLRFLHLDHGIEFSEYKMVLKEVIKKTWLCKCDYGDVWHAQQAEMLLMYTNALSSRSMELVQIIQMVEDELLSEEIESIRASNSNSNSTFIPPPLCRLQRYLKAPVLGDGAEQDDSTSAKKLVLESCMRELYHYARVSGVHVLECVLDAAVQAIRREELQEASNYLSLYPLLQPLVAAMGWDLLSGKTLARRKLMQFLWISKSQMLRLEESSLYGKQSDEVSCVEHLCDLLCYWLDLASFAASVNSGRLWNSKLSLLLSRKEQIVDENMITYSDTFVENLVLERLAVQPPMQVLFDVVPEINIQDAIELISMQPITSTAAAWKRMQDIELVHMRYALESLVQALEAMERSTLHENEAYQHAALSDLKDLQHRLDSITNVPRKIMMVGIIIGLLHIDHISVDLTRSYSLASEQVNLPTPGVGEKQMVVAFTEMLLDLLSHNLPSTGTDLESITTVERQALEWRIRDSKHFIEDWKWRLSILQRLLPLSGRSWNWKETLAILRAAPSKLLNLCMQRAEYDIGEQAVQRFSLPPEDRATLELVEWLDRTFRRESVENAMSRIAKGNTKTVQSLDFSSFRAELGSLPVILLCIDIASTAAKSMDTCKQLLDQARVMLSEIYPGVPPRSGPRYWDQVLEVSLISVTKRILQRMQDLVEQEKPVILQTMLAGTAHFSLVKEPKKEGQRQGALSILHQMIEDAHKGKRQFLSGKLHNLARAVADEEEDRNLARQEGLLSDRKVIINSEKDVILGLGLRATKPSSTSIGDEDSGEEIVKDSANRLLGSLSTKPVTYLSAFILYIATIGDVVDGTDTTHDFNFFSVVFEWPKDLLTRLVFERGSSDAAGKLADVMCVDFVHEVISACVPPVYPPRAGHDWACIPVIPMSSEMKLEKKVSSQPSGEVNLALYDSLSTTSRAPTYALRLNIVKHLAKLSPVRAVLACVFGSNILLGNKDSSVFRFPNDASGGASDSDRLFYEFALDQSERFPTLNRWIQMQSNLHRVSESTLTTKLQHEVHPANSEEKVNGKRGREPDSDTELEADDIVMNVNSSSPFSELSTPEHASSDVWQSSLREKSNHDSTTFLSFDWENEEPYEIAVDRLIGEGKLLDALALSDRCLRDGASDSLLQLLIECGEENHPVSGHSEGFGATSFWRESWRFCQRLKNKQLAAKLALKYLHRWDLDAAMDVLTMCNCHLPETDPLKVEVLQKRQALLRYKHILCADAHCKSWQEVETECKEDPEGLALRLAGKGAVSAALEVAESAALSIDLRRELQGRQLVKLLTTDPLSGGGPAEASRFLTSLPNSDDALPVAMSAMQLLSNLRSKQLLVHFFLKRWAGNLTTEEVSRLNKWALGLRVLSFLPLPCQQRCSALHEQPHLILEVLLMRKQLQSASMILKEFPMLRDNSLIFTYAAKAISVAVSSPSREQRISVTGLRPKVKAKTGMSSRSNFTNSLSNLQKEARRAFSWTPRDTGNKIAPKETYRQRKSSGLTPSDRVAWEAMSGIEEDRESVYCSEGHERLPSVAIADEWVLTGDANKDNAIRSAHRYDSSPDIILFKALLSLCCDELVSARGALDLCVTQMKNVLSQQQLPLHASMEVLGRAYHATETFVQGLMYAKSQLRKFAGSSDFSSSSERSRDTDDASSDTGSSGNIQYTDEVSELLSQVDIWLGGAELLQSLLGSGIVASIEDVADKESSACLRDRLIEDEQYSMAVYTCKKCKIDAFPVWNAWGHALIRMEHYAQARVKFKQALQLYKGDPTVVIMEIINTLEGGPPVDVAAARSMYEHFAKSAPTILDDSLSADAYLNVLYMPSTFPRAERSRLSRDASSNQLASNLGIEDGPRSNLDTVRYAESVSYLQEFARPQLLGFMFRHGHYSDACMLFFPSNGVPSTPISSGQGIATLSSSPQRPDPLATEYGTIDDLCDLCIGYGAMPVLEDVVSTRITSAISQDPVVSQHTAAALVRICNYCETHRHFNYLYKFQVIKNDHVAAGLCCIQLYMNSSSQEEAIKHLEHAKYHFEEGRFARQRAGETTKLVSKSVRGKSASEKLTEEGLIKLGSAASLQADVLRSFNDVDGPPWKYSLFGNPNDPDTFRRRCEVAESLTEKNFDLAYHVIYEFNLPAVDIYAGVAASLAERKKGGQLTEFLRNIKNNVNHDDWDQILGAAINVYANKHKERPDRLIDMLISSHRKVLACVVCGRLKSAFQIASRNGSVADVQYVAHQALHSNSLPVLDMCKQWLAQYM